MTNQRTITLRDAHPNAIQRTIKKMHRRGYVLARAIGQPSLVWWTRPMALVFERPRTASQVPVSIREQFAGESDEQDAT